MEQNSSIDSKPEVNVNDLERVISILAGAWLLFRALKKRNLGILNGGAAGLLLYRGISGHCPGYSAMGIQKLTDETEPASTTMVDPVEDPAIVNKIVTP